MLMRLLNLKMKKMELIKLCSFIRSRRRLFLKIRISYLLINFQAGVAVNGAIGKIAGCWIKKSKKVKEVAAVNAVAGVYTIKIDTKAATGDRDYCKWRCVYSRNRLLLSTDTATGNATALTITALNASENEALSCYTWSSSGTTITATEDSSKEGSGLPTVTTEGSMSVTVATTTMGVAAASAAFFMPCYQNGS